MGFFPPLLVVRPLKKLFFSKKNNKIQINLNLQGIMTHTLQYYRRKTGLIREKLFLIGGIWDGSMISKYNQALYNSVFLRRV